MKNIYLTTLLILSTYPTLFSQNIWQQKDSVKGSIKAACGSFVINGEGFVLGGIDDFGFKRKMYSYNPIQNDWDNELSIGGLNGDGLDRASASTFSIGNKGYICLGQGQTNSYFKDLWEYDSETQSWSQKADFSGSARRQAVSFSVGEFAYVGTGQDVTGLKKDFFKYDPLTNTWTALNDFPGTARRQAVGFAMGGEAYVGTGDDGVLKSDFWMYFPTTDSWIQKANFPGTARSGATGWGIFPTAFIATGEDLNFEYRDDVWEYNYFSNSWIQRANLPGPGRKNAISFVIDGVGYLGTGYNGVFMDDFYAYFGIVGLTENNQTFESLVYPNPSNGNCTIQIGNENLTDLNLEVYSIVGLQFSEKVSHSVSGKNLQLDISSLPSGNYIYILKNKKTNISSTGKLIKL
jgi:N-acetylneuraminic acid mutarotase